MSIVTYIRNRAEGLRKRAEQGLDEVEQADYKSGARFLDLVADEIENGFHE